MEKEFDTDLDFYVGVCLWVVSIVLATMFYMALNLGYCF